MRNLGPILVILFSVLILGSMFLPYAEGFDGDSNFWVLTSGSDVALAVVCVLALGCALGAVLVKAGVLRTLAAVFGGLACGVIWAFTSNVLSDTDGTKPGFWVLSVLGLLMLISAVVVAVSSPSEAAAPAQTRPASPGGHPAGWYPDPSGGTAQRYYDGTRWTDQFRS